MSSSKKFVSLHNHTGFSAYDGLGYPDEHFDFAIENGLDAMAITEHGHMNSYAHAQLTYEKIRKSGKNFKYIPGVEAYFHPDIDQWRKDKVEWDELQADKKKTKKKIKEQQEESNNIIIDLKRDENDEVVDIELKNALTVENEDETKSAKYYNPVNRRHHLVILPKTSESLKKIFSLVSRSYSDGFYKFPRIDMKMLREINTDNSLLFSSACVGGQCSYEIMSVLKSRNIQELDQKFLDDQSIMNECVNKISSYWEWFTHYMGVENCFLELQFNKLPIQNLVNRVLIEYARRNNLLNQLIVAGDSHYPRPEYWKERELYKKLGYLSNKNKANMTIPSSKEELKCELYPKNYDQLWDEYLLSKEGTEFYDDKIIHESIERTHHIAHNLIGDIQPDRGSKFPKKLTPRGKSAIQHLTALSVEGLKKRGLSDNQEYVDRLKEELQIIRKMQFAEYFITLKRIMEIARTKCLTAPGRGSGAGSLVNYVLYITDVDPIKYNLLFSRFLNVNREGFPDVDNDVSDRDKVINLLKKEFGDENVIPISNYNTFKLKTLIKDISRFYDIEFDEVNAATKNVEKDVMNAMLKPGDDKATFELKFEDALKYSPTFKNFIDQYPHISESVAVLFKQNRSLGRHAGGCLIGEDLPNQMPVIASGGEPQTPWVEGLNFKHLESIGGFIKYDILGLGTLRLIERTIELILKKKKGATFKVKLENGRTLELFENDFVTLMDGSKKQVKYLTTEDEIKV